MKALIDLLQNDQHVNGIGSGLRKLDHSLKGHRGFLPGHLYDISSVMGVHGVGYFDIIMNVINQFLFQDQRDVLFIESFNKIPWFKMKNVINKDRIKILKVKSMNEIIILFKQGEIIKKFGLIVIEPFNSLYQMNLELIKRPIKSNDNLNPITKFHQSIKCLFDLFLNLCNQYQIILFTMGQMDVYNQRINTTSKDEFFNQRILVPIISLKSPISNYYTNRILLFRDWVIEDGDKLDNHSFKLLTNGKIECLPNFICIDPKSNHNKKSIGWFSVDNKFRILDLDDSILLEKSATTGYKFDIINEIVESQS